MEDQRDYLLTIAIPTYNRSGFLKRALDSIFSQNDERVEVLVSDNASPDDTEEVVKGYCKRYPNLKYVRNGTNIGPDANFLSGYRNASGKFIVLLGDDDLFLESKLAFLLDYLETVGKDISLGFMNFLPFEGEYGGASCCKAPYKRTDEDTVTDDKKKFMDFCGGAITFMSAIVLRREAFNRVENPEKYNDTSFIHACIAFEATKEEGNLFGIIGTPCLAQDCTLDYEKAGVRNKESLHTEFLVFGTRTHYLFCELAVSFGYDKAQMNDIFEYGTRYERNWGNFILTLKALGNKKWKEAYKLYGEPVIAQHKSLKRWLRPYLMTPAWVAKILYRFVRPIYRKHKLKKEKRSVT